MTGVSLNQCISAHIRFVLEKVHQCTHTVRTWTSASVHTHGPYLNQCISAHIRSVLEPVHQCTHTVRTWSSASMNTKGPYSNQCISAHTRSELEPVDQCTHTINLYQCISAHTSHTCTSTSVHTQPVLVQGSVTFFIRSLFIWSIFIRN